jgi:hypothetical protein
LNCFPEPPFVIEDCKIKYYENKDFN